MPKTYTDNVYRIEWQSSNNINYRLDLIPSDTVNQGTQTIIDMPSTVLSDFKYSWEFDEIPLGLPTAPSLECTFLLDNANNSDFEDMFVYPFTDKVLTISKGSYNDLDVPISCGNYCELSIDYSDYDATYTGGYKVVFRGVQKSGIKIAPDWNDNSVDAEFIDITKVGLEHFKSEFFYYILEGAVLTMESSQQLMIAGQDDTLTADIAYGYFWMLPYTEFQDQFNSIMQSIVSQLSRGNYTTLADTIIPDLPTLYKQTFNATQNTIGTALTTAEIYIPFALADKTYANYQSSGTYTLYEGLHSLVESKFSSMADFIESLYNGLGLRGVYSNRGLRGETLLVSTGLTTNDINTIYETDGAELGTVFAKISNSVMQTFDNDITDYNYSLPSSFGDSTGSLQTVFTNLGTAKDYYSNNKKASLYTSALKYLYASFENFNYTVLFYKDTPNNGTSDLTKQDEFIRVHDKALFTISNTLDSDDFFNWSAITYRNNFRGADLLDIQLKSGIPRIVALMIYRLYSSPRNALLEGTFEFTDFLKKASSTTYANSLFNNDLVGARIVYNFDMETYRNNTIYANYFTQWLLTKVELTFDGSFENVECKLSTRYS